MHLPRMQRMKPFLRRDGRSRLLTALLTFAVLLGGSWVGVRLLTGLETQDAQQLRVDLGLEAPDAVCGGAPGHTCTYDDRRQAEYDRAFAQARRLRKALLRDLWRRIDHAEASLSELEERLLREHEPDSYPQRIRSLPFGAVADLRPLAVPSVEERRQLLSNEHDAAQRNHDLWNDWTPHAAVTRERETLKYARAQVQSLAARDDFALVSPIATAPAPRNVGTHLGWWLRQDELIDADLARVVQNDPDVVHHMVKNPDHPYWADDFNDGVDPIRPTSARYRTPIADTTRWSLLGHLWLALAGLLGALVAPVATATQTAREREAGTLAALRMTGIGAFDLALAMAVGPNVFAAIVGILLWLASLPALLLANEGFTWLVATGFLGFGTAVTLAFAVGWGDALSELMSAMAVGAVTVVVLLVPGLIGTALLLRDLTATGLLLGPLPAILATALHHASDGFVPGAHADDQWLLGGALAIQAAVGLAFLGTWRRRVEEPYASLFLPRTGFMLALASIAASTFALLELSSRIQVETFDHVNAVTAAACVFLLPILGWLLATSLVRPSRGQSQISQREAVRGFLRFQAFLVTTLVALGAAYSVVLARAGLTDAESALMSATLIQAIWTAETLAATLLGAARRTALARRWIFVLGSFVVGLQAFATVMLYRAEVEHVVLFQRATHPLAIAQDASPYALIFLMLLWAAGFGLILAAVLRDRDRAERETGPREEDEDELDEDGNDTPPRWLH